MDADETRNRQTDGPRTQTQTPLVLAHEDAAASAFCSVRLTAQKLALDCKLRAGAALLNQMITNAPNKNFCRAKKIVKPVASRDVFV